MKKFMKRLVCGMVAALLVFTMCPAPAARAAEEFSLNAEKKYLYVNAESRYPAAAYNKSEFDFNFKKHPANYLTDYKFQWYSENPKIASVRAGGIVTAIAPGTTRIYCDVTSKATGKKVAMVKATVIVRKNASGVTVTNAGKYNGKSFVSGNVIDLNRKMYDEKGTSTGSRTDGVVTDYTKWVYEPDDGTIKVNQSNGKYTITEKSKGNYELYCYTYQSASHSEPVVTSNRVSISIKGTEEKPTGKPVSYQIDDGMRPISAGNSFTAAVKEDGSLWLWGDSHYGQIGNGGVISKNGDGVECQPVPVKIMDDVLAVSCGENHVAAIKKDNTLWMWGSNKCGQLGDSGIGNGKDSNGNKIQTVPVKIMEDVAVVSCGDDITAAVKKDGSLWVWGNYRVADKQSIFKPKKVMENVSAVSCSISGGSGFVAAIKQDGTLWVWGFMEIPYNGSWVGFRYDLEEEPFKLADNVCSVSCGLGFLAFVKTDHTVWTWGSNWAGQQGNGNTESVSLTAQTPAVQVKSLRDVESVTCSLSSVTALKTDGSIWAWGNNYFGMLGNDTKEKSPQSNLTYPVKILDSVSYVSMGAFHVIATQSDGSLWTWGMNSSNELGFEGGNRRGKISGASSGGSGGSSSFWVQTKPVMVGDFYVKMKKNSITASD